MSLFGHSPPDSGVSATMSSPGRNQGKPRASGGLFEDDDLKHSSSGGLFADDEGSQDSSPWSMPAPRKQQSRADLVRNLLPASDVSDTYIETFDTVVRQDGEDGLVQAATIAKLFATARLGAEAQSRIVSLVSPDTTGSEMALGRAEFNVLLALIGLAQEGEVISLDGVDERRRNLPEPKLPGLTAEPVLSAAAEISAKPPPTPAKNDSTPRAKSFASSMVDPEDDPWGSPQAHKHHAHGKANGADSSPVQQRPASQNGFESAPRTLQDGAIPKSPYNDRDSLLGPGLPQNNHDSMTSSASVNAPGSGWDIFAAGNAAAVAATGGFSGEDAHHQNMFGGDGTIQGAPLPQRPAARDNHLPRTIGRTGAGVEEKIVVSLMPEKEGVFMFQHHNYEVTSQRRGSKVIRRYSDFVWLLDCLQKRYPFRVLPLLPPKRVAINGTHMSNDGAFIEKRRRGLARFLSAVVRHPILNQEQLVIMFLTVHTELAVWRKQATISVQEEFTDRALPPGLEDSLPAALEDLFTRTRNGVRRSAEIYINVCNIMDRLVKRTEGVAADHARIAMSLTSLTETSADTYASDNNEVPLLNDGLVAMSRHLSTCQTLLEDESKGWDEGVLEDLKRQRDALVSVREMFERRERLDKDNIPYLERRIQTNETKLASLRSKPESQVKPGEIEKVAENIIKDKESIVQQHNRSIFVKECIRDELITFQSSQYHVSRWNQDWAGERVKYAEMLAENWRRLMDELEGMPLGD